MRNKENTNRDQLSGACPTELFLSNNAPQKSGKIIQIIDSENFWKLSTLTGSWAEILASYKNCGLKVRKSLKSWFSWLFMVWWFGAVAPVMVEEKGRGRELGRRGLDVGRGLRLFKQEPLT